MGNAVNLIDDVSSDRGHPGIRVSLEVSFVHGDGFTSARCGVLSSNPLAISDDLPDFTSCGCGRVLAVRVDDSWIGWTAFQLVGSKRLRKRIERQARGRTDD